VTLVALDTIIVLARLHISMIKRNYVIGTTFNLTKHFPRQSLESYWFWI